MKTEKQRLKLYQIMLEAIYDNPEWGDSKFCAIGLCTIAYKIGWNFYQIDCSSCMPEIYKRRTTEGCYWFRSRTDRIAALEGAIAELSEIGKGI